MNLYYDYGFSENNFNGNISGVKWKGPLSDKTKAYGYTYDQLNRITGADYVAAKSGSWTAEKDRYDIGGISYDYNGNITSLRRNGLVQEDAAGLAKVYGPLDVLSYDYTNSGNRLQSVAEMGGAKDKGFKDGDVVAEEYRYDANGNLYEDKSKKISLIEYNYLNLPEKVTFTSGDYMEYDYDAAGRKLSSRVYKGGALEKRQDYIGALHYVDGALEFLGHEEGRVLVKEGTPEYQYHLKDHLGNARLTFTASAATDKYIATFEQDKQESEGAVFQQYDVQDIISYESLNHTEGEGASRVLRLNAGKGDAEGPIKSFAVLPGDQLQAKVYVKYLDLRRDDGLNADAIIAALAGASGYNVSVDGVGTTTITEAATGTTALLGGPDAGAAPEAFISYYLFDEDHQLITSGFKQVPVEAAIKEPSYFGWANYELVLDNIPSIDKAGYIAIELSHDGNENIDIYFDDFTIQHKHNPVVQADDYYPFGLTFNSYQREGSLKNKYTFQGQEVQDDSGLGWISFKWRNHDPAIGRFFNIDPLAHDYVYNSPYAFSENKVTAHIELEGLEAVPYQKPGAAPSGASYSSTYSPSSNSNKNVNVTWEGIKNGPASTAVSNFISETAFITGEILDGNFGVLIYSDNAGPSSNEYARERKDGMTVKAVDVTAAEDVAKILGRKLYSTGTPQKNAAGQTGRNTGADGAKDKFSTESMTEDGVNAYTNAQSPEFAGKSKSDSDTTETYQGSSQGPTLIWEKRVNDEVVKYDTTRYEEDN